MQNKIPSLEFIRGVACIVVLLSHIRVASTYYSDPAYDFIQTFTSWGKEAVIVFFLLSGIVINIATQNQINRKEYFKKRFFRIYPIYFFTIILTISIGYLISAKLPDFSTLIGNVFLLGTMEGHLLPTIPYNAVVWSISCEMFFYMVYGFLFTKNRIINIWTWLIISIISILFKLFFKNPEIEIINYLIYMLNMSFIWLLGYILYEYRNYFKVSLPTALLGLMMVPLATRMHLGPGNIIFFKYHIATVYLAPSFLYLLRSYKPKPETHFFTVNNSYIWILYLGNISLFCNASSSTYSNKILYTSLPLLSLLFYFPVGKSALIWIYRNISRFFLAIANISYPVYLIHAPIMYMITYLLPNSPTFGMIIITFIVFSLGFFLENTYQKVVRKSLSSASILNLRMRYKREIPQTTR